MSSSTTQVRSGDVQRQETETGLDENVAAALSYVLGFLSGLVMFLVESENDKVRFHAAQSLVVFGAIFVASMAINVVQVLAGFGDILGFVIGAVFSLISLVLWVTGLLLWIYLIVRTYQGSDPRIPIAASIADDLV